MCGGKFTYVGRVSAMRGAKSCLQAFELGWLEGTIIAGVMIVVKGPSDEGGVESTEAKGCLVQVSTWVHGGNVSDTDDPVMK